MKSIFEFTGMLIWLTALGAGAILFAGGLVQLVEMFIHGGYAG